MRACKFVHFHLEKSVSLRTFKVKKTVEIFKFGNYFKMVKLLNAGLALENRLLPVISLLLVCLSIQAQSDLLDRTIQFPNRKGTTYEMLNLISEQSGYLFMYDSKVINSNRSVRIPAGRYSLKDVIIKVTGDNDIRTKIFDNHILLYKKTEDSAPAKTESAVSTSSQTSAYITLEGAVKERESGEPIAYCTVGIVETGTGTVTNQNGQFRLKLPDSLQNTYIHFSHIGFEAQFVPASLLSESKVDIYLDTRFIPLEALIIRLVNPQKLIKDMLAARARNYPNEPYYLTTFYREGVNHKRGFANLTEAVFRVYKTGYNNQHADQVKMMKMRTISNQQISDTVAMKMKAGVDACLMLDIIKYLPDFLILNDENMFHYTKIAMAVTNERLAHVVAFEQKPGIRGPLYKGELYIDEENFALLHARFQIHPDYIKQAQSMFVVKRSKNVEITPQEASYTVTYQHWNGKYYINHTRGDLSFKIRKKKFLTGASTVHTWFEMATCKIDTLNVKRFPVRESQPTQNILSETNYVYDASFWDDFNIIPPEEKLSEAISRITPKIEESVEKIQ